VKDPVYSGRDVAEAVASAARALGLPEAQLRYVVLERGAAGTLGMGGTPARIAVLLEAAGGPATGGAPPAQDEEEDDADAEPQDPRAGIQGVLGAVARAADAELRVSFEETDDQLAVRLAGDVEFLLEEDAAGLEALDHLLQRMYTRDVHPRRLALVCEGYRERREASIRAMAEELVAAVRADGRPRTTPPLNSYERRLVHMAVSEQPGLRTYSVGEGADRRVTVALADAAPADQGQG